MLREWTYTASSRDALGNTSSSALEISLGRGFLHPSALEIALGLRPRAISRASGCKIPALGKSLGPRGMYFPIHPSSRQCTDTILNKPPCLCILMASIELQFEGAALILKSTYFRESLKIFQNGLWWQRRWFKMESIALKEAAHMVQNRHLGLMFWPGQY